MRQYFLLLGTLLFLSLPAQADTRDVPFREDSGLSKTEYLLTAGQFSAALETANTVLKRHPNNADAYAYRGYAYYRLGALADAAKSFRTALQLNPTHLGANKYLADLYLEARDVPRALEQLQVIRLTCGSTDCAELDALERDIDQFKSTGKSPFGAPTEAEKEPVTQEK